MMDKVNQRMKKFTLRGVLDGLRSSVIAPPNVDIDIEENLRSEHFQMSKTVRHGFPYQPTAMAFDPVQNLLAIGTKTGSLRIFGRPGVDCHVKHEEACPVLQIVFLVNEGALISLCADDQLHLWSLRQKRPELVHSLKFQRERITFCHLPFRSKWLYVGTFRGNVHVVNIAKFVLSGYTINWNKAIELCQKTHPGPVVHLSDNPVDSTKLMIGFESGALVLWDLKSKSAEYRYNCAETLTSLVWDHEGKQFVCSHGNGTLTIWNCKSPLKPHSILKPHAKTGKDGKLEACRAIMKVSWKTTKNGEQYMIFSGGMPQDKLCSAPSLTVMHEKNTTVLEMEHTIVDFLTLCNTPWDHDLQDPFGIVVLLNNDLVVVDLLSTGYPCFENPYPMDIHESPVTASLYLADCPPDLVPAFYSVGSKQKKTGFSERDWPIRGGEWGTTTCSYPEMMITGHADGSLKFWDASAGTLQVLYKLKTGKLFDKNKCRNPEPDDDPFAVQHMYMCAESRLLAVAGITHVILFRFCKQEKSADCQTLDISLLYETYDDLDSPELEYPPTLAKANAGTVPQQGGGITGGGTGSGSGGGGGGGGGSSGSFSSATSDAKSPTESATSVKVKSSNRKWAAGYQPKLCCVLSWSDNEAPPPITSLSVNSSYGLMAFGNECGLVIVDIIQRTVLLNLGTPDLYGSNDPYSRAPRSPKNKTGPGSAPRTPGPDGVSSQQAGGEECRSPTTDQLDANGALLRPRSTPQFLDPSVASTSPTINGVCVSPPTVTKPKRPHPPPLKRTRSQDKTDGSFSRSRSSSMSSLDNISKEAVQCLVFADAYSKKSDTASHPCLWVGTSLGSVLVIPLGLPTEDEARKTSPVMVSPSGTIFRLRGAIVALSFLDWNGILIPAEAEQWKDQSRDESGKKPVIRQPSMSNLRGRLSPTASMELGIERQPDKQLAIVCSEKQARVISLPSQVCAFKVKVTETSMVVVADIITMRDSVCLATYIANGHLITFSLPSLRPLLDVDFLPVADLRIVKTFCFSSYGHALYFCSPTEVQKLTLSADICDSLNEMLGELFIPCESPEAPKQNFLKNLFGGGPTSLDRQELFGETSGKASKGVAKYSAGSGMTQADQRAGAAMSEIAKAKMAAIERGEKLGELDEKTATMRADAEVYMDNTHRLMMRYKEKKWYQF